MFLMTKEFFIKNWLTERILIYALSHVVIMIFITLVIVKGTGYILQDHFLETLYLLLEKYKKEITADELSATISNLPVNLQQRILVCLEQAQAGQYAPITPEDAEKLIRRTYKTLQLLEEERI